MYQNCITVTSILIEAGLEYSILFHALRLNIRIVQAVRLTYMHRPNIEYWKHDIHNIII